MVQLEFLQCMRGCCSGCESVEGRESRKHKKSYFAAAKNIFLGQ